MSTLLPVAVYGLDVPPGDVLTPAAVDFPAAFRITMAAIDPSASVDESSTPARATLKIIRAPIDPDESELDSDDEDQIRALIGGGGDDDDEDEDEDDDDEADAGPSDPSKSVKARKAKAVEELKRALEEEDEDVDMDGDLKPNGINGKASSKAKGKARAVDEDDEDEDEDEDALDMEEFVLCTLDPTRTYQQPLDITVGEDERVFFKVSGDLTVYLTGNYVVPDDRPSNRMLGGYGLDDEEDYDLSPDEDELDDEESDELDDLDDPRITELGTDDEEVPVKPSKKGDKPALGSSKPEKKEPTKGASKKREAEDDESEPSNLDDIMAKSLKPADAAPNAEPKLSKKQQKKLKNNAGRAVDAPTAAEPKKGGPATDANATSGKADKRVQFAKNLETEATGQGGQSKSEPKTEKKDGKGAGIKTVQGVVIDDRKVGKGPAAKNGDRVSLRYIGKTQGDNRQFDANKSGPPFRFKLGAGEVIKGWDIGVKGMAAGGERRITIPPELGYGKKALDKIPANSTLVFEIKLLSIN